MSAGTPVGGSAAQQAAQAELRRAEYHRDDPGPIDRAIQWVARKLGELLAGGSGGSHAVLLLVLVFLVVGIVLVARAGRPRPAKRTTAGSSDDPLAAAELVDHRRIAAQLTADGRFAEALREWLRAAVATIEERGVLAPRPGRTGSATAREAGPLLPDAAADLQAAMRAFDEVWFGGRAASAADAERAHAAADGVATARIAVQR